jgi:hypothetical protein
LENYGFAGNCGGTRWVNILYEYPVDFHWRPSKLGAD